MPCGKSQSVVILLDDTQRKTAALWNSGSLQRASTGASRTNTRSNLKHEIRREFHPQLRRLWQTNKSLSGRDAFHWHPSLR